MKYKHSRSKCEYIRQQAEQKFETIKGTWIDQGRWVIPHRMRYILNQPEGERNNQHIVDGTHLLAHRSFVAGFLEGNTSTTRPWFRVVHPDPDLNGLTRVREYLDLLTRRCLSVFAVSNFYNAAGQFYYDYGALNTGAHIIQELPGFRLHYHTLTPGSYFIINNALNEPVVLTRKFTLNVKALVEEYGKKTPGGDYDWSTFSDQIKNCYEKGNYSVKIECAQIIMENKDFNVNEAVGGKNRQWLSLTYELGGAQVGGFYGQGMDNGGFLEPNSKEDKQFLRESYSTRKPFIVGKSQSSDNFEYGETGPATMAMGVIKSLNKKAISKDVALEKMLAPTIQGPANLKKSYITTQANRYIPVDATSMSQGGLRNVYEINPAVVNLTADVEDLRRMVDKFFFADFLLFLSMNPKTRTATETQAIINEQQLVIGPNLQALNTSYNVPNVEFVMNYVIQDDPIMPPPPPELEGEWLRVEMISTFAQAQRAADLPQINQYIDMLQRVGQLDPSVFQKANLDKLCDLYEDRLFLPAGLNRDQADVDAMRQQAQAQAQRQQMLTEALPSVAGAVKDLRAVPS